MFVMCWAKLSGMVSNASLIISSNASSLTGSMGYCTGACAGA